MGVDLLVVAIVLASAAVGLFVYCAIMLLGEGWDIAQRGWFRGHHPSHIPAHHGVAFHPVMHPRGALDRIRSAQHQQRR